MTSLSGRGGFLRGGGDSSSPVLHFAVYDLATEEGGSIHNRKSQKGVRRRLRSNLTPAEARLWNYIKSSQLDGRKFRRQHGVGSYVLDFYCPSEQLAIELDGESHASPIAAKYDAERTEYLNSLGIRVLRFENEVVFNMPEGMLQRIREHWS